MSPIILYAEDLEDDIFLMKAAFSSCPQPYTLHVVKNGEQAIQYLSGEHPYNSRSRYPLPSLILLDTYMPLVGGLEVLKWLRGQQEFLNLPVFMLSSVIRPGDRETAERLGVDGYWSKSSNFNEWLTFVGQLHGLLAKHEQIAAAA